MQSVLLKMILTYILSFASAFSSEAFSPYAPPKASCDLRHFGKKRPTLLKKDDKLNLRIKAFGADNPEIYLPEIEGFEHLKVVNKSLLPQELLAELLSKERSLVAFFNTLDSVKATAVGAVCGAAFCLLGINGSLLIANYYLDFLNHELLLQNIAIATEVWLILGGVINHISYYYLSLQHRYRLLDSEVETIIYVSSAEEYSKLKTDLLKLREKMFASSR